MTSRSGINPMTPKDRAQFGGAVAKDAAFDAVYALWRKRFAEKWTRKKAADAIGVDEGWFSKQFNGPRNWTMETFGSLVQALDGDIEIIVHPIETRSKGRGNSYDAYAEMDGMPRKQDAPKKWNLEQPAPETGTDAHPIEKKLDFVPAQ
jgi:hypothetical protein